MRASQRISNNVKPSTMSINFQDPTSAEVQRMIGEAFGKAVATDSKTFLFDALPDPMERSKMAAIAREAAQPMSTELNAIGDIKTMEDGTQWRLTPAGWHKILV